MKRLIAMSVLLIATSGQAQDFELSLRFQQPVASANGTFERRIRTETWNAAKTAIIVCDVWDKHHSLNAVRRLEEFVPRLNELLIEARRRGAVIVHAPSDCMAAYDNHAARKRAIEAPVAAQHPPQVEQWCSRIPTEELASYPIDQSDGGDDDDPVEHAKWATELAAIGRDPGLPWKAQHPGITIDAEHDYITDHGNEVWNILEQRGITSVILTGVHTNMCVLGRPFGLRRMVAGGRNVVLTRDLTDCMYNPARWPFVDHFTGNDLIVSHVERYVCPTITSDQILGGKPFRFSGDHREQLDAQSVTSSSPDAESLGEYWNTVALPATWNELTAGDVPSRSGVTWYRCTLRLNEADVTGDTAHQVEPVVVVQPQGKGTVRAWLNGHELKGVQGLCLACAEQEPIRFKLPLSAISLNDASLLVVRTELPTADKSLMAPPLLTTAGDSRPLKGRWQIRTDDNAGYANMPLPAKFGTSTDVVFGQ